MILDTIQMSVCEEQADLFKMSVDEGLDSENFIFAFMNSRVAECLDEDYNHLHWEGEAKILEELDDEAGGLKKGDVWNREIMGWIGYIYRYWHYLENISSRDIHARAGAVEMGALYPGMHTIDFDDAIERLSGQRDPVPA